MGLRRLSAVSAALLMAFFTSFVIPVVASDFTVTPYDLPDGGGGNATPKPDDGFGGGGTDGGGSGRKDGLLDVISGVSTSGGILDWIVDGILSIVQQLLVVGIGIYFLLNSPRLLKKLMRAVFF